MPIFASLARWARSGRSAFRQFSGNAPQVGYRPIQSRRKGRAPAVKGGIMPPPLLIDLDSIDTDRVLYDRQFIYSRLPHRHEFEVLHGVCHLSDDPATGVAFHDCTEHDWWAKAHIPGRPIFPGVLLLEASAQLIAFVTRYVKREFTQFIAFGGIENCRFREAITPPTRILFITKIVEDRPRRVKGDVQAIVSGRVVFEARIIGLALPDAG